MTQEAFNQIIEAVRHGDVFAQTALGIMLCEGKIVQPNRDHGLGWLKNAAQCSCLWARDAYAEFSQRQNQPSQSSASNGMADNTDCEQELNNLIGLERKSERTACSPLARKLRR